MMVDLKRLEEIGELHAKLTGYRIDLQTASRLLSSPGLAGVSLSDAERSALEIEVARLRALVDSAQQEFETAKTSG